ncbi:MAG: helix-turn-helix transcriptional regulator [Gallionellaceae bacterium]|nr:helix-turn-helix transcriptional regulator [Gallionellaceae bacterium]
MPSFSDLMSRSVDGVFTLDARQTVTFWNQACENITGIPATRALGRCCHEVMKGHDLKGKPLCKSDCPVSALTKGGPPPSALPMRIERSDGQKVQLKVSTMLVPSASQGEWSIVHIMRHGRDSQSAGLRQEQARPMETIEPAHCQHQVPHGACLLTSREREVLRLIAQGIKTEIISEQLHLSPTTVRNHIQRLMAKLGVHSRVEAAAYAHRHQLAE